MDFGAAATCAFLLMPLFFSFYGSIECPKWQYSCYASLVNNLIICVLFENVPFVYLVPQFLVIGQWHLVQGGNCWVWKQSATLEVNKEKKLHIKCRDIVKTSGKTMQVLARNLSILIVSIGWPSPTLLPTPFPFPFQLIIHDLELFRCSLSLTSGETYIIEKRVIYLSATTRNS